MTRHDNQWQGASSQNSACNTYRSPPQRVVCCFPTLHQTFYKAGTSVRRLFSVSTSRKSIAVCFLQFLPPWFNPAWSRFAVPVLRAQYGDEVTNAQCDEQIDLINAADTTHSFLQLCSLSSLEGGLFVCVCVCLCVRVAVFYHFHHYLDESWGKWLLLLNWLRDTYSEAIDLPVPPGPHIRL